MQATELRHFKEVLHAILNNAEDMLQRRDEIAVENAPDALDRIQGATDRELAICRIESDFSRLQSVRTALQRIAEGTYGTCVRCECEIVPKRLKAVPWASYCLACQTSADSQRRGMDHEEIGGVLGLAQRGA